MFSGINIFVSINYDNKVEIRKNFFIELSKIKRMALYQINDFVGPRITTIGQSDLQSCDGK